MHHHKIFLIIDMSTAILGTVGIFYYHTIHARPVASAADVLHLPPKVQKAFNLKRALTNTNRRNLKMRARSLYQELQHTNHLSSKHANVILAIIRARTSNLKDTKNGFFKMNKPSNYKKYASKYHINKNKVSSQYAYLNHIYHLTSLMKHKNTKAQLVNKIYHKLYHKTLSQKDIKYYLHNTEMK